ncbi:hypothetical protein [Nonomuraea rubra]|uniref:hypothetical protein n=1 Tax=Nonomuraea rubra TaxID=46180 RepID=UPI0031E99992
MLIIGASWIGAWRRRAAARDGRLARSPVGRARAHRAQTGPSGQELGELFAPPAREQGVDLRFGTPAAEITEYRARASARASGSRADVGRGRHRRRTEVGLDPRRGPATSARASSPTPPCATSRTPTCTRRANVAEFLHPLYEPPHPRRALGQRPARGPVAARSMLGQEVVHDMLPYFYHRPVRARHGVLRRHRGPRRDRPTGATRRAWSSSSTGCATSRVIAGMNVNVWDGRGRHHRS